MVWSDQSQFPFYVIDNNGNVILTIDSTGLHLDGTVGHIDAMVSAGQPTIFFSNPARTSSAFINAPILGGTATLALDSGTYFSSKYPGTTLVDLIWLTAGHSTMGPAIPGSNPQPLGGYIDLSDTVTIIGYVNNVAVYKSFIQMDDASMLINGPNTLGGYTQIKLDTTGIFLGSATNPNIVNQVQYLMSDGFLRLSSAVNPAAAWTNLTMKNGWTAAAGGWQTPQARLNPLGAVEFRGFAQAGTRTDGTVMFSLPFASLRPTTLQIMAVGVRPTGAGVANSSCLFNDGTNSDFQIYGVNDGITDGVILTGLSYYP